MEDKAKPTVEKLLLMGSSAFKGRELPVEVRERIDEALRRRVMIIVVEASGASRTC